MPHNVHIWPMETGILDLQDDAETLAVVGLRDIQSKWKNSLEAFGDRAEFQSFVEEMHREWSIETGIIENLYDIERGVTQSLIEQGFQASLMVPGSVNQDPEYIAALLRDQKEALEGLFAFVRRDRELTVGYVRELHAAMTRSQDEVHTVDQDGNRMSAPMIHGEWKKHPNFPRRNGTTYHYCPPEHVAAEMDRLVAFSEAHKQMGVLPEVEAAWLHHRFTQIHPFQDGNGRVARALASLILIRGGLFPMVVPREERSLYIEMLERADAGDLRPLVLFIARLQQSRHIAAERVVLRLRPARQ